MPQDAETQSTMRDPRHNLTRVRERIRRHDYVVDERAVATAMLARPLLRLYLSPPRDRRLTA
jgi:hypothetical protein